LAYIRMNPSPALSLDTAVFTLSNAAGLSIQVMDHGATWVSCTVPLPGAAPREVLLGCARLDDYRRQTGYLGATIGRYANRIGGARFPLDGREVSVTPNEGANQLHGGPVGFDKRLWTRVSHTPTELVLSLVSEDGDQGYPGRMETTVCYRLGDDLSVQVEFAATVSAPCPVNLTNHAYFNLDGDAPEGDIRAHRLRIAAQQFLPVDAGSIPTGERRDVAGTGFDFRTPRPIGEALMHDEQQQLTRGYDHSYWLDAGCADGRAPAAEVVAGDGRVALALHTQLPALQVYSGNYLPGTPTRVAGATYAQHAGFALEPQYSPDTPNHPEWPGCVLRPGERFEQALRYVFTVR
jgi:aldose 1-epimerase